MPRQYTTLYGVEQTRRSGSALFPPELSFAGQRFTLERDGLHMRIETEEGALHLILDRERVACLVSWMREQHEWMEYDLDQDMHHGVVHNDCGYCVRNLSHSRQVHQEALDRAKEQRKLLSGVLNERLFESA
ncbi:MAG TPA: hypothetical protein VKR06_37995 [Ktedonosporobacter sp.]|nr:hypothetical protein [Ktedonosporobacter sp.]